MVKILIVDDQELIRESLVIMLKTRANFENCYAASSGVEALELVETNKPDVVLMDIKVKGDMEGIDAAKVILELRIPVVYLTANTDDYTFERSNIEGSYGFVPKPYEITKLDKTLKLAIKRAELEEQKLNDASGFN